MTTYAIGGQSSGDFRETSARLQLLHVVTRNSVGLMTPDALTQANPPVVTGATTKSTTLAAVTKTGILGSTVAFTRPDVGNNYIGGPVKPGGSYAVGYLPLGLFINDSLGNAFENTPGVASGRAPYVCGSGSTVGASLYETKIQLGGSAGNPITYAVGDKLYASANGLLTNVLADAYEYNVAGQNDIKFVTLMGTVKVAPDANSSLLVLDMRV
jgi:hypothetical protein